MREGWEIKTLEDVCDRASSNVSQNQLDKEEGPYPIFGASGLIKNVSFYHNDKPYLSIVKDGSGVGRVTKMEAFTSVIGTLQYIIPKENIDLDYLYYSLISVDFKKYVAGAAIPHIYFKDYKNEPFLWMPLAEQKLIVSIIDKTFAAIDKAKANIEKNLKNSKELFESCLNNLFSKKTEDWNQETLANLTKKIGSGATPHGGEKEYKQKGISLIRSLNVHDGDFRKKDLAFIDDKQASKLNNVTVEENDVLFNITGASVTRCCIVPKETLPARVNQHVSIIRVKTEIILPEFVQFSLTSKENKDALLLIGEMGATRQAITKSQLEEFILSFPKSLNEQKIIIKKMNDLKALYKNLKALYNQKKNNLEELKKSILQKAFSGKLTAANHKTLVA